MTLRSALRQALCGLRGHTPELRVTAYWLRVRCVSCGHQTPGWDLNVASPIVTVRGDARRHRLGPRLIASRRIA